MTLAIQFQGRLRESLAEEIGRSLGLRGAAEQWAVGELWAFTCCAGELAGVTFYVRAGASAAEVAERWEAKRAEFSGPAGNHRLDGPDCLPAGCADATKPSLPGPELGTEAAYG
ncbi:MAG: hypothetical protein KGL39_27910 [Patescibacteria group bacterium]|nr:hypothetical protein [Patescibacteria group bacterium]